MYSFTSSNLPVSPSLQEYINTTSDKTQNTENKKSNNATLPITQKDEFVMQTADNEQKAQQSSKKRQKNNNFKNMKNANFRSTKAGMFLEFAFSLATLGASLFCMYKFLPKIYTKITSNNVKEGVTSIDSVLAEIRENMDGFPRTKELSLPESLKELVGKIQKRMEHPDDAVKKLGTSNNSILLYGPPGTGKTTFAQAFANDIGAAEFFNLDVTNLGSMYVNQTERNLQRAVKAICQVAKDNPDKKYVVFIDEIDSVMMVDKGSGAKHSQEVLNEFKRCLESRLAKCKNVITIGATNLTIDPDTGKAGQKALDSAMLDRFGSKVMVDLPSAEQISTHILSKTKNAELVSPKLRT